MKTKVQTDITGENKRFQKSHFWCSKQIDNLVFILL